jgi:integrase
LHDFCVFDYVKVDFVQSGHKVKKNVTVYRNSTVKLVGLRRRFDRLLDALAHDRLLPLYIVFLGCGLRRGEALALTLDDVDFERNEIHVRKTLNAIRGMGLTTSEPKTERSRRTVAMPDFVRKALLEHLAKRKVRSEYLFCTVHGTPFSPRNVLRHFKSTLRRAGLPETTRIHDLRHYGKLKVMRRVCDLTGKLAEISGKHFP